MLTYSGGLDTSAAIRWLAEEKGYETIRLRALDCGAAESIVVDAVEEFADEFVAPALCANALYMGEYSLVSALSRRLIVRHPVRADREHDAAAVAHGCTGKGNDQVRFEVGTMCLAPTSPWRRRSASGVSRGASRSGGRRHATPR